MGFACRSRYVSRCRSSTRAPSTSNFAAEDEYEGVLEELQAQVKSALERDATSYGDTGADPTKGSPQAGFWAPDTGVQRPRSGYRSRVRVFRHFRKGPFVLAYAHAMGISIPDTFSSQRYHSHKRGRCGVRREAGDLIGAGFMMFVGGSRFLDDERSRAVDYFAGAPRRPPAPPLPLLLLLVRPRRPTYNAEKGQSGCFVLPKGDGFSVEADYFRAQKVAGTYALSMGEVGG